MRGARQRRRSVVKLVTGANYGPGWPDCAVRARRRAGSAAKRLINEHPTPFFFSGDGRHFFSRLRRYAHRWIQRRVESPRLVAFGKGNLGFKLKNKTKSQPDDEKFQFPACNGAEKEVFTSESHNLSWAF